MQRGAEHVAQSRSCLAWKRCARLAFAMRPARVRGLGRGVWVSCPDGDACARWVRRRGERAPRRRPRAGRRAPRRRRRGWRRGRAARRPGARARHLRGHRSYDCGCASACACGGRARLSARAVLSLFLVEVSVAGCPAQRALACLQRWCTQACSFLHTKRIPSLSYNYGEGPHGTAACGQVQRPGRAGLARTAEPPWICRPR
jgi:hypothetical protein